MPSQKRQIDSVKVGKANEVISCVDARADSLTCLVKYAAHDQKSAICEKFFANYKACIKSQSEKKKADRIAARGGSRW